MSRLLFAAARGARLQFYGQYGDSHTWAEITRIPLDEAHRVYYRIHPDDAHLQYGPVSTALRGAAAKDFSVYEEHHKVYTYAAFEMADVYEASWNKKYEDELHRSLFLLILAEALADEGL